MVRQLTGAALLLVGFSALSANAAEESLTFDEEMATVIWARQCSDTQAVWLATGNCRVSE